MARSELKVKDHGLDAMFKRAADIARLRGAKVKVGVLADSSRGGLHKTDKKTGKASPLTVAEIFAVLHYGTQDGHIPPRPVLTDTLDAKRGELKALGGKLMAAVIFGQMDLDRALNLMGAFMAAEVKKAITAGVLPPNSPETIRRKGSSKPLIDTGRTMNSITWALAKDGK